MAFREGDALDAPIAGMSLTHELGARSWQTPPELVTIEEVLDFYLPKLSNEDFSNRVLDILEMGVPITSLVEVLTLGGVMEGLHTIDTAVLVNPVLVEFIEGMAKLTNTEYRLGDVDAEKEPDKILLKSAMDELKKVEDVFEDVKEDREETEENVEEKPKGLMARKGDK